MTAQPRLYWLLVAKDDERQAFTYRCETREHIERAMTNCLFSHLDLDEEERECVRASVDTLLDEGALYFEGDPPIYLHTVASATDYAPAAPSRKSEGVWIEYGGWTGTKTLARALWRILTHGRVTLAAPRAEQPDEREYSDYGVHP